MCADAPTNAVDTELYPPTAEGGAFRSQVCCHMAVRDRELAAYKINNQLNTG